MRWNVKTLRARYKAMDLASHVARLHSLLEKARRVAELPESEENAEIAALGILNSVELASVIKQVGLQKKGSKTEMLKFIRALLSAGRRTMAQTAH